MGENETRVIKLRAWDKRNGIMFWPCRLTGDLLLFIPKIREHIAKNNMFSEDIVFLEYTGLKDKHGKEIYDGDIMCWNEDLDALGVVSYTLRTLSYQLFDDASDIIKHYDSFCNMRMVGNIYENPDLMESHGKRSEVSQMD